MDRKKEGRHGASSGKGSASSHRRPRTSGPKDSPGIDDDDIKDEAHSSRLRERSRRESSSLSSIIFSDAVISNSRHKRRRQSGVEIQVHACSSVAEDVDETTEEVEMSFSEDDDLPHSMPRRFEKFKSQGKPSCEGSLVDISAVPRKARTAMIKRPHESPSPPVADGVAKQTLLSSCVSPSSAIDSVPPSANVPLKLRRRMKPGCAKPRASKLPKVSTPTSISEQEVEIAEALFDLARMLPNQESTSYFGAKIESVVETEPKFKDAEPIVEVLHQEPSSAAPVSVATNVCAAVSQILGQASSYPVSKSASWSASPASSPVRVLVPHAEAPKRKRPRAKSAENGRSCANQDTILPSTPGGMTPEHAQESEQTLQPEGAFGCQTKAEAYTMMSSHVLKPPTSAVQRACSVVKMELDVRTENSNNASDDKVVSSAVPTVCKIVVGNPPGSISHHKDNEAVIESSGLPDSLKLELGKRGVQAPSTDTTRLVKLEIDLMEVPKPIAANSHERTAETSSSAVLEHEDSKMDLGATARSFRMDGEKMQKDEDIESHRDEEKKAKAVHERNLQGKYETDGSQHHGWQCESKYEREHLNENDMIELPKNISQISVVCSKGLEKTEKYPSTLSDASTRTLSTPLSSTTSSALSRSMALAGWPGSLPLGYFPPATAATVASTRTATHSGTCAATADENCIPVTQMSPFPFPSIRQPWKHCSAHVYISHFIAGWQQMQRHPLWLATYGAVPAGLYNAKPYNLNISVTPPDSLFGKGTSSMLGISGANVVGPTSNLGLQPLKDRPASDSVSIHGLKERKPSAYLETLTRKSQLQPPVQAGHQLQPSLPLQSGPAFGFQGTLPPKSTATSSPVAVTETTASRNATLVRDSLEPVSISANAGSDPAIMVGSVNTAAAQFHYLQAMMQQPGFPIPFPPPQFAPGPGHITQQHATQLFSNPFYNSHLLHPSMHSQKGQGGTVVNASPGMASQKQQQHHVPQRMQSYKLSESQQQQQQWSPPPAPCHHTSVPILQRSSDKGDNMMLGDSRLSADTAMPGLSLRSQDLTLMTPTGPKPIGKMQQKQQTSAQQHSQKLASGQQQTSSPAVQMNIKGLESQASQAYANVSLGNLTRNSVCHGPLGIAPVAAVMSPQGHAMLQTFGDPSRQNQSTISNHQSLSRKSQHHLIGQGQYLQSTRMQHTNSNTVEENRRNIGEASYTSNSGGQGPSEDRMMPIQQTLVLASLPRIDSEATSMAQNSPNANSGSGSHLSREPITSGASTNAITSSVGNQSPGQNGQCQGEVSGLFPLTKQHLKPGINRAKMMSNGKVGTPVTQTDFSASLSDRNIGASSNKLSTAGLSFTGQNISNDNQNLRRGHTTQLASQAKHCQRAQGTSSVHASVGTPPRHAVQKHQSQSQSRGQQGAVSIVLGTRDSPASGSSASNPIPLLSLAPVTKCDGGAIKDLHLGKNYPLLSQKHSGDLPAKTSSLVPLTSNTAVQIIPGLIAEQQQQNTIQNLQPTQSLMTLQQSMAQHQSNANQVPSLLHKQLQIRQQVYLQQQAVQHQHYQRNRQQFHTHQIQEHTAIHNTQKSGAASFGAVTSGLSLKSPHSMSTVANALNAGRTVSIEGVGPVYQAISSKTSTPQKSSGNIHEGSSDRKNSTNSGYFHSQATSIDQQQGVTGGANLGSPHSHSFSSTSSMGKHTDERTSSGKP